MFAVNAEGKVTRYLVTSPSAISPSHTASYVIFSDFCPISIWLSFSLEQNLILLFFSCIFRILFIYVIHWHYWLILSDLFFDLIPVHSILLVYSIVLMYRTGGYIYYLIFPCINPLVHIFTSLHKM